MKKQQAGSGGRPQGNKVIWMMVAVLLLLVGLIVLTLAQRTTTPQNNQNTTLLDTNQTRSSADLMFFYDTVKNGDSWSWITETIGWPGDCLREITTVNGNQQVCMWFNNEISVVVMLLNDQVVSKTKVGF